MNKIISLWFIFTFFSCNFISAVPIHDEVELIQTIKKLHVDFSCFNDVQEYLAKNCDTLKDRKIIKSSLKNQLALMRLNNGKRYVLSTVLWCICSFVGITRLGDAANKSSQGLNNDRECLLGLSSLGIASFLFCYEIMPMLFKVIKLEILCESM